MSHHLSYHPPSVNGWMGGSAAAGSHSSLSMESELKKREIQSRLDQLNKRQASRETASGRLGVGNRAELIRRLQELQRKKELREAVEQRHSEHKENSTGKGAAAPKSPPHAAFSDIPLPHHSNTSDSAASLEWAEKLRQAKAKYWSTLDSLAPDWKSNTNQRRLEQVAKYEKAIDALLARRQQAHMAYAKERELQKLLTQKQMELHNLTAHEREEVRARQLARQNGYAAPATTSQPIYPQQYAAPLSPHSAQQAYASNIHSPSRVPPPAQAYTHHSQTVSPRGPQYASAPYQPANLSHRSQGQYHQSHMHHDYGSHPGEAVLSNLPSDAVLDAESHAARLNTAQRELLDLDAWKAEQAAEESLRRSRREERELTQAGERRLEMERRRAMEAEQEEKIKAQLYNSKIHTASMVGLTVQQPSQPSSSVAPNTSQIRPSASSISSNSSTHSPSLSYNSRVQQPSVVITRAEPLPTAIDSRNSSFSVNNQSSVAASSSVAAAASAPMNTSYSSAPTIPAQSNTVPVSSFVKEDDGAINARVRAADLDREREEEAIRWQQQQQQEQELHAAEERRVLELQQARQQQEAEEHAAAERRAAEIAAANARAEEAEKAEKARQEREKQRQREEEAAAAAATTAAARPVTPPSPKQTTTDDTDEDDGAKPSGFGALFGGLGSALGFMGGGKKKPPPKKPATTTTTTSTTATAKPASSPAVAASASKPVSKPAAGKKAVDSDDDVSSEDDSELKPVPTLSSTMLKKKPLATRAKKPIWSTGGDDEDFEHDAAPSIKPTLTRPSSGSRPSSGNNTARNNAALPEDDEFAF